MRSIYLLDTNIISEVTKPAPNESIITNLEFHSGTCAISSITWFELLNGMELLQESPKKDKLRLFLTEYVEPSFPIFSFDSHAAKINAAESGEQALKWSEYMSILFVIWNNDVGKGILDENDLFPAELKKALSVNRNAHASAMWAAVTING